MGRSNRIVLALEFLAFIALFGGASVAQGGLYLDTHEGDTYHLLDILLRMEMGQTPHLDFMTPIGFLAFLPIVLLLKVEFSIGMSILWAQIAVAVLLLPIVVYTCQTRLSRWAGYAFGFTVLGLVLAMTYGGPGTGPSVSMHYNRWAWSLSFLMLLIALVPSKEKARPVLDGTLIGLIAFALLSIKVTYFVCLIPVVTLAILWGGHLKTLLSSLVAGLVAMAITAAFFGLSFWVAYFENLLQVATSDVRPFAGVAFNKIVAGPARIGPVLVTIAAALLLRRTERVREGTLLLLLVPGFLYITYQNFGNDLKWLLLLPILLATLRPDVGAFKFAQLDLSAVSNWLSIAAFAFYLPSLFTLAVSPLTHASIQVTNRFIPMLPSPRDNEDIYIRVDRANTMTAQIHLDEIIEAWSHFAKDARRSPKMVIGGIELENCELFAGTRAYFAEFAAELGRSGIQEGSRIFNVDILSSLWLFGPYAPLEGGAPWYYGGLTGFETADFVLVPKCSIISNVTRMVGSEISAAEVQLNLVQNTDLYALFEIRR